MTTQVCPDAAGTTVSVDFYEFETEAGFDELLIFDGPNTAAPLILNPNGSPEWEGSSTGSASPIGQSPFIASDPSGCLTFVWNSDVSVTKAGWAATVQCVPYILGCTDPCDEHYDPLATVHDSSICSGINVCACLEDLSHSGPLFNSTNYQVSDFIISSYQVDSLQTLNYQAGNIITLDTGFSMHPNATFNATIEDCDP